MVRYMVVSGFEVLKSHRCKDKLFPGIRGKTFFYRLTANATETRISFLDLQDNRIDLLRGPEHSSVYSPCIRGKNISPCKYGKTFFMDIQLKPRKHG